MAPAAHQFETAGRRPILLGAFALPVYGAILDRHYQTQQRALSKGVGDANVVNADIEADNGLIHVIDRVLLPAAA